MISHFLGDGRKNRAVLFPSNPSLNKLLKTTILNLALNLNAGIQFEAFFGDLFRVLKALPLFLSTRRNLSGLR